MANYQLKKTNVLLGGQMKYDLVVKKGQIVDIHITPISDSVAYNKHVNEDLLNYTHVENIKKFYQKSHGHFYDDFVDPRLSSIYPLPEEYTGPQIVTTYDAGGKRIAAEKRIYDNEFEIFCPVWIEQISDIKKLKFNIQFLHKKDLKEDPKEDPKEEPQDKIIFSTTIGFNDQMSEYFNNFCKHLKLDKTGCDWVFNITPSSCSVCGLNVQTGLCKEQKLFNLYDDLSHRERPLMEFNNMILNELNKNQLICKQLFNFNLCFNLQDIVNAFIWKELYKQILNGEVKLWVAISDSDDSGSVWELKDIFTNHIFIDKQSTQPDRLQMNKDNKIQVIEPRSGINALDYLQDYKYIHFVDKNKINPTTCHWCISANPDEHFNMYNGMTPVSIIKTGDKIDYVEILHHNGTRADLNATEFSNYICPYWCNAYILSKGDETKILNAILNENYDNLFSHFNRDCWVKNVHYKYLENMNKDQVVNFKVMIIQNDTGVDADSFKEKIKTLMKDYFADWTKYGGEDDVKDDGILLFYRKFGTEYIKMIIVAASDQDVENILYKNFIKSLIDHKDIQTLCYILRHPYDSDFYVRFDKGLYITKEPSPSIQSTEINYFKSDSSTTILRNFGKIKPFFIHDNHRYQNIQYLKLKWDELDPQYQRYVNSDYIPRYPSIDYFAFKEINNKQS